MPMSAPPKNRFERRRAETRQALIRAARQILAETREISPSVQAIAERADVGSGSFYNHFESKTELFDAAVTDALEEFGQAIDERVRGIEDPAELVAAGFRLTARMADSHPELMRILRDRGLGEIHSGRGLAARALRDLELGIASTRFTCTNATLALSAVGGTLISLVALRLAHPDLDGEEAASGLAEMVLRMLGVPPDEAHDVTHRPLPDLG
ncbi:TetR/AcrR family transcriptional regulator [Streptomyces sp. NPDC012935]|uniref:TetR/AcrR family transcriptional regulator n=1 Tax=Streptomyces sp. NPDC012935 TaxID=3364857 RepID=UPI00369E92DB